MSIDQLLRVAHSPSRRQEARSLSAFAEIEQRFGLTLPIDYKQLILSYGMGSWMQFLWVLNPFSAITYVNLLDEVPRQLDAERQIRERFPKDVPFSLYPEPGGLLPWAGTDNGNRLYWLTEGPPDKWPTIVYESRGPLHERHDLTCTEFLSKWAAGLLKVSVFPDDLDFGSEAAFKAYEPIGPDS